MIFRIFRDFFGFFRIFLDFIYDLNSFKINTKIIKKIWILARAPRGCDVARKARWQRHADPRIAYVARYISYIIYLLYI